MALLARTAGGSPVPLPGDCVVGRAASASLRIDEPFVSAEHARIRHRASAWTVRDLGSRNGTWLNGARLSPGTAHVLSVGDTLAFGDPEHTYRMTDADPPQVMAQHLTSGETQMAEDGILALPSKAQPRITVFEDGDGQWVAEVEGEPRTIEDGVVLSAGGEPWRLHLPLPGASTRDMGVSPLSLAAARIRLCVSRDEEQVEITATAGGRTLTLAPRAHHYLLLVLARERIAAEAGPNLPHERGWVAVDALCRMLAVDEMNLNTQVFRIRGDFASLGFVDGGTLIERRRGLRTLRLGTTQVSIVTGT